MSEKEFFRYKNRPLVRSGKTIYYGSLNDNHVVMFQIVKSEKIEDLDYSTRVMFQLISTDESIPLQDRILKKSDKENIYSALEVASVWLDRANKIN